MILTDFHCHFLSIIYIFIRVKLIEKLGSPGFTVFLSFSLPFKLKLDYVKLNAGWIFLL